MTTIADNIRSMAALVSEVKRTHHLTENTVLRIVDMNFALSQQQGATSFGGDEEAEVPGMYPLPSEQEPEFTTDDEPDGVAATYDRWVQQGIDGGGPTPEEDDEPAALVEQKPN